MIGFQTRDGHLSPKRGLLIPFHCPFQIHRTVFITRPTINPIMCHVVHWTISKFSKGALAQQYKQRQRIVNSSSIVFNVISLKVSGFQSATPLFAYSLRCFSDQQSNNAVKSQARIHIRLPCEQVPVTCDRLKHPSSTVLQPFQRARVNYFHKHCVLIARAVFELLVTERQYGTFHQLCGPVFRLYRRSHVRCKTSQLQDKVWFTGLQMRADQNWYLQGTTVQSDALSKSSWSWNTGYCTNGDYSVHATSSGELFAWLAAVPLLALRPCLHLRCKFGQLDGNVDPVPSQLPTSEKGLCKSDEEVWIQLAAGASLQTLSAEEVQRSVHWLESEGGGQGEKQKEEESWNEVS